MTHDPSASGPPHPHGAPQPQPHHAPNPYGPPTPPQHPTASAAPNLPPSQPTKPTPPGRMLANAALVFLGGTVGAGLRIAISSFVPELPDMRLSATLVTVIINVLGAFLLGMLTPLLVHRERLRLLFGTGLLGAFTTYSAFATETASGILISPALSFLFIVAGLGGGLAAAWLGWLVGARGARR